MSWVSTRFRIAFALVSIVISLFFSAVWMGLIPSGEEKIIAKRKAICEAIAINASVLVAKKQIKSFQPITETIIRRNDELRSVGLRRNDGKLIYSSADHQKLWGTPNGHTEVETETAVTIPIFKGDGSVDDFRLNYFDGYLCFTRSLI